MPLRLGYRWLTPAEAYRHVDGLDRVFDEGSGHWALYQSFLPIIQAEKLGSFCVPRSFGFDLIDTCPVFTFDSIFREFLDVTWEALFGLLISDADLVGLLPPKAYDEKWPFDRYLRTGR